VKNKQKQLHETHNPKNPEKTNKARTTQMQKPKGVIWKHDKTSNGTCKYIYYLSSEETGPSREDSNTLQKKNQRSIITPQNQSTNEVHCIYKRTTFVMDLAQES
jgi:hypothetical protein